MANGTVIELGQHAVKFEVPEGCEGKKVDDSGAIVTFEDESNCKAYVEIRPYDASKLGSYYDRRIDKLGEIIDQKFQVNPISEKWSYFLKGAGIAGPDAEYWMRYAFERDHLHDPEIDVWLAKLGEDAMCCVLVGLLKGKADPINTRIRNLIEGIK